MLDNPDSTLQFQQLKENLPLNPSLFFARVRIPKDPIITYKSYFLADKDLSSEKHVNFELSPPFALSINNFNLKAEATDFIERVGLQSTIAGKVVDHMSTDSKLGFMIVADVNDRDLPLPRVEQAGRNRSHVIRVITDKDKGYMLECESLNNEQIDFCLKLLTRSLEFTLGKAGKGRDIYSIEKNLGEPSDRLVYDNSFVTASDEDLQRDLAIPTDREKYGKLRDQKTAQLKYLKMTLEEIMSKRK